MNWIKVNHPSELPKDKEFFAIWKGAFCIAEYDHDESRFYMSFLPAQTTSTMKVDSDREAKFHFYCIPEYPDQLAEPRTEK
jgi:hypothetical protein